MIKQKFLVSPLLLAALTLAGCGGGGGSEATTSASDDTFLARGGIPGPNRNVTTSPTTGTTSPTTGTTSPTTGTTSPTTGTTSPTTGTTAPAPDATALATYSTVVNGVRRTFDFDGSTPFVNATTGQSDMVGWLYNGIEGSPVTNAGVSPWIQKMSDNGVQVTRFSVYPTDKQLYNWRTQAGSYPFENYKHYRYDLEFKLDPSWDFNMTNGDGLFWQAKGQPKSGQFSNASMSLAMDRDNLYFALLYPQSAMNATTWPTSLTWTNSQYVQTNFPLKKLVAGRYYKVRMEFFADDRPPQFGGQGYLNVWLDDQLWIQHKGPNLHPDQAGPHRFDYGWYAWGGQPSSVRTVYYKTSHAYVK